MHTVGFIWNALKIYDFPTNIVNLVVMNMISYVTLPVFIWLNMHVGICLKRLTMIISSYSVLQGPTRVPCSQRWQEGYQSLEQIIQTNIYESLCKKNLFRNV